MDVNSHHKAAIKNWMHEITRDGGVTRYDDLHVDRINPEWKERRLWFDAALDALQIAMKIRRELTIDLSLAVAFSLDASDTELCSREELEAHIDWTPPSLYLFEKGSGFWSNGASADPNTRDFRIRPVDPTIFGLAAGHAYLISFTRVDTGDQHRCFLVAV